MAIESTSNKMIQGDDADEPLESFGPCKHPEYGFTNAEHPTVSHKCTFMDTYGRCTRDECVFDGYETSKVCNKQWDTCILCGNALTVPPNTMDVPFCDLCRARLYFAEHLPFTCLLCGKKQNRPSKAPFSQICDKCFKQNIANDICRHWCKVGTSPAEGYDKL